MRNVAFALCLLVLASVPQFPQSAPPRRTVAITVDDLPYVRGSLPTHDESEVRRAAGITNRKLLSAFDAHHVPVTGFVIQQSVESLGAVVGTGILKEWIAHHLDLGNHTYSHPDLNDLSPEQMEQDIVRGESVIKPLMTAAGENLAFFRFPFNHTGETKPKHDEIAAFLKQRGYSIATCTIDTSDYIFNDAYLRILANHDAASAGRLREDYLAYTSTEIDYYSGLNRQVFGYEPPQVMLLHDNRLNGDVIDEVLQLFEKKGYRFVSLDAAQSDAAYQVPDTFITKFGQMWGYRWAKQRNIPVNGSLETEPPKWVTEYGRN